MGRSAFVGLASIVVLLPLPGQIARMIRKVQMAKMKKVRSTTNHNYRPILTVCA